MISPYVWYPARLLSPPHVMVSVDARPSARRAPAATSNTANAFMLQSRIKSGIYLTLGEKTLKCVSFRGRGKHLMATVDGMKIPPVSSIA